MPLHLHAGDRSHEIGTPSFFKAFFSTVFVRLEGENWGSRFPQVMLQLYSGTLDSAHCSQALVELATIETEFALHPPSAVIWDFENRDLVPPWGSDISPDIRSLADYFVTSAGSPLIQILRNAFEHGQQSGQALRVQ